MSATAFGIAPMAPDAADLPRRIVTEDVAHEALGTQLEALADHALELSRSDLTRGSDTADSLLKRMGVADAAAATFLRRDPVARRLLEGRPGKMVQVVADGDGALRSLTARYPAETADKTATHFTRLSITRDENGWHSAVAVAPLQSQVRLASGTVQSSFFAASDEARVPDAIAAQMAEIFAADIDFHRELRKGDTFSIVYEALTADGEPITWNQGTGRVLAAEFVNGGKAYQSVWYRPSSEPKGAYFGFDGQSKRRSFLASPMEFSRITSGFAMRFHPILQSWRAHRGVDYGAPTGTAVRTVADGVVEFAGVQNGYGNVIEVRHSSGRSTVYAHLSRIGVRKGERVTQGETIGAVGSTGWATGPHLHFEFKVNGQQQDPLSIAKGSEAVMIPSAQRADFTARALTYKSQLALAQTIDGAHGVGD